MCRAQCDGTRIDAELSFWRLCEVQSGYSHFNGSRYRAISGSNTRPADSIRKRKANRSLGDQRMMCKRGGGSRLHVVMNRKLSAAQPDFFGPDILSGAAVGLAPIASPESAPADHPPPIASRFSDALGGNANSHRPVEEQGTLSHETRSEIFAGTGGSELQPFEKRRKGKSLQAPRQHPWDAASPPIAPSIGSSPRSWGWKRSSLVLAS